MKEDEDDDTTRIRPRLAPEEERRLLREHYAARQPVRLGVTTDEESFPDEFRDVLEVQILEYREDDGILAGEAMRVLRPVWTLVPKDEDSQLSLDLRLPVPKGAQGKVDELVRRSMELGQSPDVLDPELARYVMVDPFGVPGAADEVASQPDATPSKSR